MDENLRKFLIYMLKNNKIYYINKIGEYEQYSDKERLEQEINEIENKINELRWRNITENSNVQKNKRPKVNYEFFIDQYKSYLEQLKEVETIDINEDSSLNEISNEISKIGLDNYEDYKLYQLRSIKKQGINKELDYIKANSNE